MNDQRPWPRKKKIRYLCQRHYKIENRKPYITFLANGGGVLVLLLPVPSWPTFTQCLSKNYDSQKSRSTFLTIAWDTFFRDQSLSLQQTQELLSTINFLSVIHPLEDNGDAIRTSQIMCLPTAELSTKNETKRQLCSRLVDFLIFNLIHLKKKSQPTQRELYT